MSNKNLRVYIVWLPILNKDDRGAAVQRTAEFHDDRLSYFWDGERRTGQLWQRVLDLRGIAWDVYFLYDAKAKWTKRPQAPDFWMHQLGAARGKAPFLDQSTLEKKVRELLRRIR